MATSLGPEHLERWRRQGMGFIDPETGLEVLGRLMDGGPAQAAVLPITGRAPRDGQPVGPFTAARAAAGSPARAAGDQRAGNGAATGWAERLREASDESRKEIVGEFLLAQLSGVLQISPSSVPVDEALTQLGLDSLMAVELRNRIEKGLGISVPVVRLLQDSSAATLGAFVLEQVVGVPAAAGRLPMRAWRTRRGGGRDLTVGGLLGDLEARGHSRPARRSTPPVPGSARSADRRGPQPADHAQDRGPRDPARHRRRVTGLPRTVVQPAGDLVDAGDRAREHELPHRLRGSCAVRGRRRIPPRGLPGPGGPARRSAHDLPDGAGRAGPGHSWLPGRRLRSDGRGRGRRGTGDGSRRGRAPEAI